jgi:uncharacterized protein YkwD
MNIFSLQGNWVDLIIALIILFYVIDSLRSKFWVTLAGFISFLLSLLISLKTYSFFSNILTNNFSLPHPISNALGFLIASALIEAVLSYLLFYLVKKIPGSLWNIPYQKILNIFPASGEALVLIAFILSLALSLPIPPFVKEAISSSKIGGPIVRRTENVEKGLNEIFGGVVEEGLNYLSIKPGSEAAIPINVASKKLSIDKDSEAKMFDLVNMEREKRGIAKLVILTPAVIVAENYAKDMWERGYFSHYSPEGEDVADRLTKVGIKFTLAGENLALAPTLITAYNGLINSEGHRANILDPDFKKLAIGVVDNGFYGKIFVQIFTD